MMITLDEDGLVVDLPRRWRVGFNMSTSRYEWGIGVSVYFSREVNRQVGVYVMLLPFYFTVDLWHHS